MHYSRVPTAIFFFVFNRKSGLRLFSVRFSFRFYTNESHLRSLSNIFHPKLAYAIFFLFLQLISRPTTRPSIRSSRVLVQRGSARCSPFRHPSKFMIYFLRPAQRQHYSVKPHFGTSLIHFSFSYRRRPDCTPTKRYGQSRSVFHHFFSEPIANIVFNNIRFLLTFILAYSTRLTVSFSSLSPLLITLLKRVNDSYN